MNTIASPTLTEPLWTRARAMFARAVAAIGDAAALAAITALGKALRRDIIAWLAPLEHVVRKLLLAEAAELHRAEVERAKRAPRIERIPLRGMAMHWRPGSGSASFQARYSSALAEEGEPGGSRSNLDKSQPKTWRASFSFALPRNPRLVPNSRAPRIRNPWAEYAPPKKSDTHASAASAEPATCLNARVCHSFSAPFRLARRFEALRRVLENPAPHAARLARALAREAKRQTQLVLRYLLAPCRSNAYDGADPRLGLDALGFAWDAPEAFKPDSS